MKLIDKSAITSLVLALSCISLFVVAPLLRIFWLAALGIVVGVIALALMLKGGEGVGRIHGILAIVGIIMFFASLVIAGYPLSSGETTTSEAYPIYHITAPFGEITKTQDGHFAIFLLIGSGELKESVTEIYKVKYIVDGEILRTMDFPATTDLHLTGKAELVKITTVTWSKGVYGDFPDRDEAISWQINLPKLPEIETITQNYTVIP